MKATWPAAFGALVASTAAPIVAAAGGMILLGACTSCQSTVREAAIPVIAAGSFDGVEADQRAHRLYLGDSAAHGIDVVDISSTTPRFVRTIDVAGGAPRPPPAGGHPPPPGPPARAGAGRGPLPRTAPPL